MRKFVFCTVVLAFAFVMIPATNTPAYATQLDQGKAVATAPTTMGTTQQDVQTAMKSNLVLDGTGQKVAEVMKAPTLDSGRVIAQTATTKTAREEQTKITAKSDTVVTAKIEAQGMGEQMAAAGEDDAGTIIVATKSDTYATRIEGRIAHDADATFNANVLIIG
ncbi:MAG: hypothetical protein WC518_02045 [Patescibacteria group bacterium]